MSTRQYDRDTRGPVRSYDSSPIRIVVQTVDDGTVIRCMVTKADLVLTRCEVTIAEAPTAQAAYATAIAGAIASFRYGAL